MRMFLALVIPHTVQFTRFNKSGLWLISIFNVPTDGIQLRFLSFINSVSMAYFLGPLFGGEVAQYIGFSWLMSLIGCANIGYAFFLFISVFGLVCLQVSVSHPRRIACVREDCDNKSVQFQHRNEDTARNGDSMYLKLWPPTYSRQNSEYQRFYNTMDNPQLP